MAEPDAWAARWRELSEQVLGEMQQWRAAHPRATLAEIEAEEGALLAAQLKELDEILEFILSCNKPAVLARGGFERLTDLVREPLFARKIRIQGARSDCRDQRCNE